MPAEVNSARIATEARRAAIDPGDRAAHLVGNREQAAAHILHPGKIRHDIVRAGAGEHFRRRGIGPGRPGTPCAAMDEDDYRGRRRSLGPKNVELLDLARPVGAAERRADAGAGALALAHPAVPQLLDVRLVRRLIVGGVELRLRVVQKDQRLFLIVFANCGVHGRTSEFSAIANSPSPGSLRSPPSPRSRGEGFELAAALPLPASGSRPPLATDW